MKVTLGRSGELARDRAPLLAVLLGADELKAKWLPPALGRAIRAPIDARDWSAKELETALTYQADAASNGRPRRVLLVGLGPAKKLTAETLRRAAAAVARRARQLKIERVSLALSSGRIAPFERGRAVGEGLVLGGYAFHGVKSEPPPKAARAATVHFDGRAADRSAFGSGLAEGVAVGRAQCFARDVGNQPANVATPSWIAAQARRLSRVPVLSVRALRKPELERRRFGGLLGVARGSVEPPVFLELAWRPRSYKKTVCLVGKGLTFDTGGISLKSPQNMEEMKFDKCGGAAVLGTFMALAELQPRVRVFGLVPCTENMPSGSAIKPGDVLKTFGGITVEVVNTDAEGRLILADALGRAKELEPDYTIDLATLTGACVVALGHRATGMFCGHDELAGRLLEAADASGEPLWRLPLWEEYLEEMKSSVADVKNSGSRFGGAVTAAAFLKKFAGDLVWAHLDIAGTAWDAPKNELYEGGASGVGVRTLVRFIEGLE